MLVTCPHCRKTLRIPDTVAGKKIRCPACSGVVDVPAESNGGVASKPAAAPPPQASSAGSAGPEAAPRKARIISRGTASSSAPSPPAGSNSTAPPMPAKRTANTNSSARKEAPESRQSVPAGRSAGSGSSGTKARPRKSEPSDEVYDDGAFNPWGNLDENEFVDSCEANPFAPPQSRSTYGSRSGEAGRGDADGRRLAGLGLLIQGWATVAMFLTMLGMVGIVILMGNTRVPSQGALPLIVLGAIGIFVAAITLLVGECMCLSIPPGSGAKGLITASVALMSIQIILSILQQLTGFGTRATIGSTGTTMYSGPQSGGALLAMLIIPACGLGHMICYELFLRKAALYRRRDDLAKQALIILVGVPACFVIIIGCALIAPLFATLLGSAAGLIMLIPILASAVGMLALAVMHVALQFRVGFALRS